MGCIFSKLLGADSHHQLSEDDAPKEYSWDKREKVDVKNFVLDKLTGEIVSRLPGSINGQQFIIQNCENCDIYVFDHCATVTIDDCINCRIFISAIKSSIFIRDCTDCVIATCCQQFRTRDCKKLTALLCCVTKPIIESTTSAKFGCFQFYYPQLGEHLKAAGISRFNNNWSSIHDFTPVPDENNYSLLRKQAVLTDYLPIPTQEPFTAIEISVDIRKSTIPHTVGSGQHPSGQGCLIIIFHCDAQVKMAVDVMRQLQEYNLDLVRTIEMSLSEAQGGRLFDSLDNSSLLSAGPVVMLQYAVPNEEQAIFSRLSGIENQEKLSVAMDLGFHARQIECLDSFIELQMGV